MLHTVIATKLGMSQAWTNTGKRVAVTRCRVDNNIVIGEQAVSDTEKVLELGYGKRTLKNVTKPLQGKITKSGFSVGVRGITGVRAEITGDQENATKVGDTISAETVLTVGDVVQVQGTTKGRGFAGAIKRHGFHGGPKTHGQSDRERAVGSIGAGTYPGRVWKGKKMPGHYGVDTKTVAGLVVLHVDPETQEVWLSGPVPGHMAGFVKIMKTGKTKSIELNRQASGIPEPKVEEAPAEATQPEQAEATEKTEK